MKREDVYKSRHHIGSRRAAENIITYNESFWPSAGMMASNTMACSSNKRATKRKIAENSVGRSKKMKKEATGEKFKSRGKTDALQRKEITESRGDFVCDESQNGACLKNVKLPNKQKSSKEGKKSNAKKPDKMETNHYIMNGNASQPDNRRCISKSIIDKVSKTTKKNRNEIVEVRPTFLRRVASLNAQAKVNILYDFQAVPKKHKPLKKRDKSLEMEEGDTEDDLPLAMLLNKNEKDLKNKTQRSKCVSSNKNKDFGIHDNSGSKSFVRIKVLNAGNKKSISSKTLDRANKMNGDESSSACGKTRIKTKEGTTSKSDTCNNLMDMCKRGTSGASQKKQGLKQSKPKIQGLKQSKPKKKANKVASKNQWESWRFSKRMASLNAKAMLQASYQSSQNCKSKSWDKPAKQPVSLGEDHETKKSPGAKCCDKQKLKKKRLPVSVGSRRKADQKTVKMTADLTDSDDVLEALKKDLSDKNTRSRSNLKSTNHLTTLKRLPEPTNHMTTLKPLPEPTNHMTTLKPLPEPTNHMTTLKPLPEPKMATGQILMIGGNEQLMHSDNTIHWTNVKLLQQSSNIDAGKIKTEIVTPTPHLPGGMLSQYTPSSMASYQCAAAPPIVPSSQFQSYTVGGLGSITNLPMMPGYASAFSVPSYTSAIFQHGYYQPAGPLIQALPDSCLLQHPIAIRPIPPTHIVKQEADNSQTVLQSKSKRNPENKGGKGFRLSKAESKSSKKLEAVVSKQIREKTKKGNERKTKKKDSTTKSLNTLLKDEPKKSKPPQTKKNSARNTNPWSWEGEPVLNKIPSLADEHLVERMCYPAMRHKSGDMVHVRDCVLVCSGSRKTDLPYVAKVAALWENPPDNEKMMSVLWYYRPEHTDAGRQPQHADQEIFTSKHWDENSVACIEDKAYVLTSCEFARYRGELRRHEQHLSCRPRVVPEATTPYPRSHRLPPEDVDEETVFLCRSVYDFRQKRILKNPS